MGNWKMKLNSQMPTVIYVTDSGKNKQTHYENHYRQSVKTKFQLHNHVDQRFVTDKSHQVVETVNSIARSTNNYHMLWWHRERERIPR